MSTINENKTMALQLYLERTKTLLSSLEKWSANFGLQIEHGKTTINEERHGQYETPTLILCDTHSKHIARVVPFGESLIGVSGRVDVVGEYGKQEKIVYLNEGGPTMTTSFRIGADGKAEESTHKLYRGVDVEGWYWVSPSPIRRAFLITEEVFADLLSAVTNHEFKS